MKPFVAWSATMVAMAAREHVRYGASVAFEQRAVACTKRREGPEAVWPRSLPVRASTIAAAARDQGTRTARKPNALLLFQSGCFTPLQGVTIHAYSGNGARVCVVDEP